MTLLHGFNEQAVARPETYELLIEYLLHKEMALRELAAWNLSKLVPGSKVVYDAADPIKRETGYRAWKNLIPRGKMPGPNLSKKTASLAPGRAGSVTVLSGLNK